MRPRTLTLCGWGPYKREERVDFSVFERRGIFLITGATGAGKTTIFDAISYALYGALSGEERDKEKGSVRSDFAEPSTPTYVELVMEHGGNCYRIRRNPDYLRPKKRGSKGEAYTKEKENAVLYYPDDRVLEGVKEVNAALKEILGLDFRQFKKISMIAQGEFAKLLVAPPKEKTRIFREIFDTGVYERFTQNLGVKARAAYNRVTEQKHKLEEDVSLLTAGLEESCWSKEKRELLKELTMAENWNYAAIEECLEQMKREAEDRLKEQKSAYEETKKRVEELTAELAKLQKENEQIQAFLKVSEEKEKLAAAAPKQAEAQERYKRAVNAAEAEKAEERCRTLEKLLAECLSERQSMEAERQNLITEAASLKETAEKEERIRSLLELRKAVEEERKACDELSKQLEEKQKLLASKQSAYLEKDSDYRGKKAVYEDGERKRRLNVIGLAAELLKEGEPCPVCGSLHHPNPAKADCENVSEEVLEELKDSMEEAYGELIKLHEESVALRTTVEGLADRLIRQEEKRREKEKQITEEFQEEVYNAFLALPPAKALSELQKKCGRAKELSGLIQEKDGAAKRLAEKEKALGADCGEAQEAFRVCLTHYGFCDTEDYVSAVLSAARREELRNGIEEYRAKAAANNELYSHLEGSISVKEPVDLTGRMEMREHFRQTGDTILKEQKLWERQLSEVDKTILRMGEKRSVIQKESQEYGFIKDLENMASGNNPKRLVFEQYVLAGYFEEILRAANLRFAKMSGGRYEMSRVEQVGDGRVKDNLEIQVMDYYTGKNRSVRTLSGGESFKASLALALGMSDVIQAMNGGIRVDTLFVDEGFGALDSESLDQACDTLMSLAEKKQLIGIISHVPELRERIESQLVIEKTGSGSRIVQTDI